MNELDNNSILESRFKQYITEVFKQNHNLAEDKKETQENTPELLTAYASQCNVGLPRYYIAKLLLSIKTEENGIEHLFDTMSCFETGDVDEYKGYQWETEVNDEDKLEFSVYDFKGFFVGSLIFDKNTKEILMDVGNYLLQDLIFPGTNISRVMELNFILAKLGMCVKSVKQLKICKEDSWLAFSLLQQRIKEDPNFDVYVDGEKVSHEKKKDLTDTLYHLEEINVTDKQIKSMPTLNITSNNGEITFKAYVENELSRFFNTAITEENNVEERTVFNLSLEGEALQNALSTVGGKDNVDLFVDLSFQHVLEDLFTEKTSKLFYFKHISTGDIENIQSMF